MNSFSRVIYLKLWCVVTVRFFIETRASEVNMITYKTLSHLDRLFEKSHLKLLLRQKFL